MVKMVERKGVVLTIGLVITAKMQAFKMVLFIRTKEKSPRLQSLIKLQNRCLLKTGCLLTITKKAVNTILDESILLSLQKLISSLILYFTNYLIFKFADMLLAL
jgi:hypothetical protein